MSKGLNILRLQCLLSENVSNNFNSIILSLVHDYLYANANKEQLKMACYHYIVDDLNIKVDLDLFDRILQNTTTIQMTLVEGDCLINLSNSKYDSIESSVKNHSIESYIKDYVKLKNIDVKYEKLIFKLLTKSIYENINSFTIDNISSLITEDLSNGYTVDEIAIFNDFLEDADNNKQAVLYNTFLKAIEFAILTSGKGVNTITEGIFDHKHYVLDSNILFRLLGIDGSDKSKNIERLLECCIGQGIKFSYTSSTHQELEIKIKSVEKQLISANKRGGLNKLSSVIDKLGSVRIMEDFFSIYSRLRIDNKVSNPEGFGQILRTRLRDIRNKFSIDIEDLNNIISNGPFKKLSKDLYDKKKELGVCYNMSAAEVDSRCILYVEYLRGNNNFNYSDVKSFYLTADKILNTIMAEKAAPLIPLTVLPSQLFIIHSGLSGEVETRDYDTFISFLKRKTTEYNISGRNILRYIEDIQEYTTDNIEVSTIIKGYVDTKYIKTTDEVETLTTSSTSLKNMAQEFVELKTTKLENESEEFNKILEDAKESLYNYYTKVIKWTRFIDIFLAIIILPIIALIQKLHPMSIIWIIIVTILISIIKFFVSSKTPLLKKIGIFFFKRHFMSKHYFNSIKRSSDFKSYYEKLLSKFENNIWKKIKH